MSSELNITSTTSVSVKDEFQQSEAESPYYYCLLHNIPSTFHTSDLRNFFAEFIHAEKFDLFHFRHRPQTVNIVENVGTDDGNGQTQTSSKSSVKKAEESGQTTLKKFCGVIRFSDDVSRSQFVKHYHMKLWMDKEGNDLPTRCVISKANLREEDLKKFSSKELHPPKFMPRGNVGTPNEHFLNLIRECRLPPSLIKKLGLEFPRARVYKRYSKVPLDYGTNVVSGTEEYEEEEIKTGKGHNINDTYLPRVKKKRDPSMPENGTQVDSDNVDSPKWTKWTKLNEMDEMDNIT